MADSSDKNINPSERFFSLLKELIKRNLLDKNAWIATITAIDGRFGLSGVKFEMQSANLAGPAGVAKCLAKEYPAFNIRCIDTVSFESGENLGRNILNEFLKGKKFSEVGYDKEGRWKISVAESARTDFNIAARPPSISKDDLILITGGLSGITAEITLKVAKKYSPKIVLLGRSELKGKQEETFREIKKYASSLEYIKQDVSDENSLSKCLRQISKHYAKIDGIIHGAGIIRDKLIRDKSKESFLEVYQTKTVLLKVLEQQLDFEKLKFIFLFSSIAARWGNHGQSDYCAANEVLNKWASAAAAKWPNINAVSFNWGPWDRKEGGHGGMLSKELAAIYKANGIELISLEQGSELCLEELYLSKSRQTSEVLISGSVQQIGKEYFKEEPSSNAV